MSVRKPFWWALLGTMALVVVLPAFDSQETKERRRAAAAERAEADAEAAAAALKRRTEWSYRAADDEFTGDVDHHAHSPSVKGEPYGESRILVICDGDGLRVAVWFDYINLTTDVYHVKYGDGGPSRRDAIYSDSRSAIMLCGDGSGDWCGAYGYLAEAKALAAADSLTMRMTYYKDGTTTIRYPLKGSAAAIGKVLAACGQ